METSAIANIAYSHNRLWEEHCFSEKVQNAIAEMESGVPSWWMVCIQARCRHMVENLGLIPLNAELWPIFPWILFWCVKEHEWSALDPLSIIQLVQLKTWAQSWWLDQTKSLLPNSYVHALIVVVSEA